MDWYFLISAIIGAVIGIFLGPYLWGPGRLPRMRGVILCSTATSIIGALIKAIYRHERLSGENMLSALIRRPMLLISVEIGFWLGGMRGFRIGLALAVIVVVTMRRTRFFRRLDIAIRRKRRKKKAERLATHQVA